MLLEHEPWLGIYRQLPILVISYIRYNEAGSARADMKDQSQLYQVVMRLVQLLATGSLPQRLYCLDMIGQLKVEQRTTLPDPEVSSLDSDDWVRRSDSIARQLAGAPSAVLVHAIMSGLLTRVVIAGTRPSERWPVMLAASIIGIAYIDGPALQESATEYEHIIILASLYQADTEKPIQPNVQGFLAIIAHVCLQTFGDNGPNSLGYYSDLAGSSVYRRIAASLAKALL
jgi:hypothetical protein